MVKYSVLLQVLLMSYSHAQEQTVRVLAAQSKADVSHGYFVDVLKLA